MTFLQGLLEKFRAIQRIVIYSQQSVPRMESTALSHRTGLYLQNGQTLSFYRNP
jgi:hypothetical protein